MKKPEWKGKQLNEKRLKKKRYCRLVAVLMTIWLVFGSFPGISLASEVTGISDNTMKCFDDSDSESALADQASAETAAEDSAYGEQSEDLMLTSTAQEAVPAEDEELEQAAPGEEGSQPATDTDYSDNADYSDNVYMQENGAGNDETEGNGVWNDDELMDAVSEDSSESPEEDIIESNDPEGTGDFVPGEQIGCGSEDSEETNGSESEAEEAEGTIEAVENTENEVQETQDAEEKDSLPAAEESASQNITEESADQNTAEEAAGQNSAEQGEKVPSDSIQHDSTGRNANPDITDPTVQFDNVAEEKGEEETISDSSQDAYVEDSGYLTSTIRWSVDDDGRMTISGTGPMPDFTYNESEDTVNAPWGDVGGGIVSLTIENGITTIGDYNFACCWCLGEVSLPDTIREIGDNAFYLCGEMGSINLENGLKKIGRNAFSYCISLGAINIPESVDYIGSDAFYYTDEFIINCRYNSYAMDYAIENGIDFIAYGNVEVTRAVVTGLKSQTYTGSAIRPVPTVKLGIKKLVNGKDYTLSYKNNVNPGTATIIITGCGAYGGTQKKTFKINRKSIAKASVTVPAYKYWEGWGLTPWPTVKLGSKTLKKGTDYGLSYSNNKNVGTAAITITGKGNYTGTVKKTFRIVPKPTTITKITAGSAKLTIVWKKQASQTSGYQIQYSSRSDFATQKTVKAAGSGKTSTTISGLAKKHKYYLRVRPYKTVGGTNYYSTWSPVKTATTGGSTSTSKPAAVKLNVTRTIVPIGMKKKLSVSGTNKTVKWTSSASAVATVSSSGLVVGKKAGTTTIKAKVSGKTLTCTITVINKYDARQVANMVLKYVKNYYSMAHLVEYSKQGNIVKAVIGRPMGEGAPGIDIRVNIATGKAVREEDLEKFFSKVPRTFVLWNCQ